MPETSLRAATLAAHPGQWHIAVPNANRAARSFWRKTLHSRETARRDVHYDSDDWCLYDFQP